MEIYPEVGEEFLAYTQKVLCYNCWLQLAETVLERGSFFVCTHKMRNFECVIEGIGNYYEVITKEWSVML